MLHGQCYKRRAATPLYERAEQRWSAPGNEGSDGRTLTGMLQWLSLLASLYSPRHVPSWYPGSFPQQIFTLSQVFTTTRLFPLICFSSQTGGGRAAAGLPRVGRPLKAKTFSHATRKPRLTDCTRPGLLFTLSRCGLPLVFLSNDPSLTESMCQSKSLRVRAARAPRATQAETRSFASFFKAVASFHSHY